MSAPTLVETDQAPDPAEADRRVVDLIALYLAAASSWGADEIDAIADLIALVRPHPGDISDDDLPAYADALLARHDTATPKETQP